MILRGACCYTAAEETEAFAQRKIFRARDAENDGEA